MPETILLEGYDENGEPKGVQIDVQTGSDGSNVIPVVLKDSPMASKDFPENTFVIVGPLTTASADVGQVQGIQGMHSGHFEISGLTSETLAIKALSSSGADIGPFLLEHIDNATPGTVVSSAALGNGTYKFKGSFVCAGMQLTKSAATETITVEGQLSGAAA